MDKELILDYETEMSNVNNDVEPNIENQFTSGISPLLRETTNDWVDDEEEDDIEIIIENKRIDEICNPKDEQGQIYDFSLIENEIKKILSLPPNPNSILVKLMEYNGSSIISIPLDYKLPESVQMILWPNKNTSPRPFQKQNIFNEKLKDSKYNESASFLGCYYQKINYGIVDPRLSVSQSRRINKAYIEFSLIQVINGQVVESAVYGPKSFGNFIALANKSTVIYFRSFGEHDALTKFLNYPYQPLYKHLITKLKPVYITLMNNSFNPIPYCARMNMQCSFCDSLKLIYHVATNNFKLANENLPVMNTYKSKKVMSNYGRPIIYNRPTKRLEFRDPKIELLTNHSSNMPNIPHVVYSNSNVVINTKALYYIRKTVEVSKNNTNMLRAIVAQNLYNEVRHSCNGTKLYLNDHLVEVLNIIFDKLKFGTFYLADLQLLDRKFNGYGTNLLSFIIYNSFYCLESNLESWNICKCN